MKMSDIGFLKTEPNWPQNFNTEKSVTAVQFSKTDFDSLGAVFHIVSFTVHLPTWYLQRSKVFVFMPSAASVLTVLSTFGWQLVGPIQ